MVIKRKERSTAQQAKNLSTAPKMIASKPTSSSFNIADVYLGTLITGAAMKNIQKTKSIVSNDDRFGIVANHLKNYELSTSFSFQIDVEKKKLSIVGAFDVAETSFLDISGKLKFEWNFQE